jgi:hypothetical protein
MSDLSESNLRFSTRDLLSATTVISIILAIGVWLGGFIVVAVAVGLIQAFMLFLADWLIRPENRRALVFTTAMSWITLGIGLIIIAIDTVAQYDDSHTGSYGWLILEAFLVFGAAGAFLMARHRWRQGGN